VFLTPLSAISWRPILVVEEAGVLERTTAHGQATGKLYHLRLQVECTLFCNLDSFVTVGNYNNTVGGHNYLFFYSSITVCEVPKLSRNVPLGILKNVTMY
jgi:hypothetical protein